MDLAKLRLQAACCAACASTRYRLQRFLLLLGVIEGRRRFNPRNVEERSDCTETFLQRDEDIGDIWFLKKEMKRRGGGEEILNCTEIFSLQGGGNGNAKSDAAPAAIGNTF